MHSTPLLIGVSAILAMIHRIFTSSFWLTGVACATVAIATAAQAGHIRYVSTAGSNANPCTLAKPCKTLQRGINQTPAGGELRILDSGDYGTNGNIKKSITISGNGHTVSIVNPLTINRANATVVLRGLALSGRAGADNGIRISAARTVHVERCVVHGFPNRGIRHQSPGKLIVLDSVFRNNRNGGLSIFSGAVTVTVDNSRFEDNQGDGIQIGSNGGSVDVAVNRSVVAGNSGGGIAAESGARVIIAQSVVAHHGGHGIDSAATRLTIDSSVVHNNSSGVIAQPNSTVVIANSTFTNNVHGILNNGGTILTRGNNTASGNINADTAGTLTALPGV